MSPRTFEIRKGPTQFTLFENSMKVGGLDRHPITLTLVDGRDEIVVSVVINGLERRFDNSLTSWKFRGRLFGTPNRQEVEGHYQFGWVEPNEIRGELTVYEPADEGTKYVGNQV